MSQVSICIPVEPGAFSSMPATAADKDEALARLAKALAHPARVAILRMLLTRDSCVCGDIVKELPLAQSTVSQHLKQLKEAGLIRGELDRPRICYCADLRAVRQLVDLVADLANPTSTSTPTELPSR